MLSDLEQYPTEKSWAKSVKTLLENSGFYNVWLNQGVENEDVFLPIFKQRLKDNYLQLWNSELDMSTRARTYRLFCNFGYQQYLNCVTIEKYRIALSRFRVSAHRLEVESGRWHKPNKIPYNERKCQLCNALEDEFHFLFECPLYFEIRKLYIKKYYWKHPNMIKFIQLMTTKNVNALKNLAIFICKGFDIRNNRNYVN